jgi:hypothetical protein
MLTTGSLTARSSRAVALHAARDRRLPTWVVGAKRTDIENLITHTAAAGTRWRTLEETRERAISGTFYLDDQYPADAASQRSHAAYVEVEQHWREVDDLVAPTRG